MMEDAVVVSQGTRAIVHHFTDTSQGLQLEVEYRHPAPKELGKETVFFKRVILKE